MPINSDHYPFTAENVSRSPSSPGVYAFWRGNELTYYGSATISIQTRLASHKRGDDGPCTQNSTHYQREICSNPREREKQLLVEYRRVHGVLPRCNDVMP